MSQGDQITTNLLREYFAVMESKDYERLGDFYGATSP